MVIGFIVDTQVWPMTRGRSNDEIQAARGIRLFDDITEGHA